MENGAPFGVPFDEGPNGNVQIVQIRISGLVLKNSYASDIASVIAGIITYYHHITKGDFL